MEKRNDDLTDISDVSSTTECTGLMPALPLNTEEYESYQQLSSTGIPKKRGNSRVRPAIENSGETTVPKQNP
ncbi:MAG: hypothetical protein PHY23_06160 [Oscillospiraceae bacterium]|jgi:hypothetical protein|nr:hypothetical protein [Oscillospiraceae bacterium]